MGAYLSALNDIQAFLAGEPTIEEILAEINRLRSIAMGGGTEEAEL